MRENKFRVWIDSMQKMVYDSGVINGTVFVNLGEGYEEIVNYKDIKLMQFTGMYDSNNIKIYEDDFIVCKKYLGTSVIPHLSGEDEYVEHHEEEIYKVVFEHGAFVLKNESHKTIKIWGNKLEVLGNAHKDNLDELKKLIRPENKIHYY